MTKRNERTSPRVVKIAANVLEIARRHPKGEVVMKFPMPDGEHRFMEISWRDLVALAASCLTQAPDKPKRAVAKRSRAK